MKSKPTYEELEKRAQELERRIGELEAQPREYHYHYHPPVYQQPLTPQHQYPYIGDPLPNSMPNPLISPWGSTTLTWPTTAAAPEFPNF